MRRGFVIASAMVMASCGEGGNSGVINGFPQGTLSIGPKIFVTAAKHVGDFKNDPLLTGTNAMSKADSFCNKDVNKPNDSTYKALLVDGITRDAVKAIDWVLKPDTTYYRPTGDIEIGKTIGTAIFPALYADLTNSIADKLSDYTSNIVWTGIGNAANYASTNTCAGWSVGDNGSSGTTGARHEKGALSITSGGSSVGCAIKLSLYCVEQK